MQKLIEYFRHGLGKPGESIGMEVETSFTHSGQPATLIQSQGVFQTLLDRGWKISQRKGALITAIADHAGNKVLYELGRQNLEVAAVPATRSKVVLAMRKVLDELYDAASTQGLDPFFRPILYTAEDLLVIPDERDAVWVALDGRWPLMTLAMISAVQFTVEVSIEDALPCLNRLGGAHSKFLADYPQENIWRTYVSESKAGYRPLRYGGPLQFAGLEDYCVKLCEHDVVQDGRLVPYENVAELDIPLYLRSIWWYFRLRRYGDRLCIEVRPIARREDELFPQQLDMVLNTMWR